jgi:hypothetical protein
VGTISGDAARERYRFGRGRRYSGRLKNFRQVLRSIAFTAVFIVVLVPSFTPKAALAANPCDQAEAIMTRLWKPPSGPYTVADRKRASAAYDQANKAVKIVDSGCTPGASLSVQEAALASALLYRGVLGAIAGRGDPDFDFTRALQQATLCESRKYGTDDSAECGSLSNTIAGAQAKVKMNGGRL